MFVAVRAKAARKDFSQRFSGIDLCGPPLSLAKLAGMDRLVLRTLNAATESELTRSKIDQLINGLISVLSKADPAREPALGGVAAFLQIVVDAETGHPRAQRLLQGIVRRATRRPYPQPGELPLPPTTAASVASVWPFVATVCFVYAEYLAGDAEEHCVLDVIVEGAAAILINPGRTDDGTVRGDVSFQLQRLLLERKPVVYGQGPAGRHARDDVIQEVALSLLERSARGYEVRGSSANFVAWFNRVARSRAGKALATHRRTGREASADVVEALGADSIVAAPTVSESTRRRYRRAGVDVDDRDAVQQRMESERTKQQHRRDGRYSLRQAAEALNVSCSTIRRRMEAALRAGLIAARQPKEAVELSTDELGVLRDMTKKMR